MSLNNDDFDHTSLIVSNNANIGIPISQLDSKMYLSSAICGSSEEILTLNNLQFFSVYFDYVSEEEIMNTLKKIKKEESPTSYSKIVLDLIRAKHFTPEFINEIFFQDKELLKNDIWDALKIKHNWDIKNLSEYAELKLFLELKDDE